MTELGYWVFLIATFPIVVWCSISDLSSMRIPNKANLALFGVFLLLGAFFMPLPEFGIRLVQAFVVLVIFFFLNMAGLVGGGDAKLFAAIAPFVALEDTTTYLFLLSFISVVAVIIHKLIPKIPPLWRQVQHWASWSAGGKFPFGLPLATSLSAYLLLSAIS